MGYYPPDLQVGDRSAIPSSSATPTSRQRVKRETTSLDKAKFYYAS